MPLYCPYQENHPLSLVAVACGAPITWVVHYLDDHYVSCDEHARSFMDEFWEAVPYPATATWFSLFYLDGADLWQVPITDDLPDFDRRTQVPDPEHYEQYELLRSRPAAPSQDE